MPTIYDPIYVQFRTLKQELRPYETVADISFLINGGMSVSSCVQVAGLNVKRLRRVVRLGISRHALAVRDGLPLAESDEVLPGDMLEFVEAQLSHEPGQSTPNKDNGNRDSLVEPRWNDDERSLWVGDTLIKQFEKPAKNQVLVLKSFQEQKWSKRIDDPLKPGMRDYTIDGLNRHHTTPGIVRFKRDGTGKGIKWFFVQK
jgi:hypothetical protein